MLFRSPRLLSDNGPSYVSADLAEWLDDNGMDHVRGAPNHPQTQGKIERWHQTLKNRILLENYYLPGDLEAHIGRFVEHYNHQRYHQSIANLTPQTFTSAAARPSYSNAKKSNITPSKHGACIIAALPHKVNQEMRHRLHYIRLPFVSIYLNTDSWGIITQLERLLSISNVLDLSRRFLCSTDE